MDPLTFNLLTPFRFASLFDVLGIEPTLPKYRTLEEQRELYQFSSYPKNPDGSIAQYPPHLKYIPDDERVSLLRIFNPIGLAETQILLKRLTPDEDGIHGRTKNWLFEKARALAFGGQPEKGITIQDVVDYNKYHRKIGTDIMGGGNIGMLDDWYSDRRFAEQQFTGTNPTTIALASPQWIAKFREAAKAGNYTKWITALDKADPSSLFIQDGSYFREAAGTGNPTADLHYKPPGSGENWAVGSVSLFQMHRDGKLHPVAICIDYKGSMANSVTIFNKRMTPSDSTRNEKEDWPWRYAKTCAQVTDWMRHELAVHLTLSHFVEEAIIVATNRTLPMDHPVYRILYPHWYKTLSLNAAARATLVPQVIADLVGLTPDQCYKFLHHAYDTYDFVGSYIPNDLARRGFPNTLDALNADIRYKNYPYAKDILAFWNTLRTYVHTVLSHFYPTDKAVAEDGCIQSWVAEIRTAASIPTFPEIGELTALVDAVTMCIHIASPFHTAVNYLQNFYHMFVAAKPPALCSRPPQTLDQLRNYTERDLVAALPINRQRMWLLAAQVPWLLSFRVEPERSLLNYAASEWRMCRDALRRHGEEANQQRDEALVRQRASERLYKELRELQKIVYRNSTAMDKGSVPYLVLDPGLTAVSILI